MSANRGEEVMKLRRSLFNRYAKLRLLYQWSTGNKSNAGVHSSINNQGATLHVICTPEGMFGGFASKPWSSAGGFQADSKSFIWGYRDGTLRKFVATGTANHLHFAGPIRFGDTHAIFLNLNSLASSYIKPCPARFSGFTNAADLNPATVPFTLVDYFVYQVSDEDEYVDSVNLGRDWTASGRDELLRQAKAFQAYAPSLPNSEEYSLNILTIGERGSGKSSFLNAVVTTLRQRLTKTLHAAPSPGDVTTKQRNISLERFGVKLGVRDVPGWTSVSNWPTYQRLLRCVITGRTCDQEALLPITEELLNDLEARPAAPFEQQVHCIIVLRPLEDDRPAFVEKLRSIVQEWNVRVPVMVALTKVDAHLPATATLKNVYALDTVLAARETLARDVDLDANCIVPMASYGGGISFSNVPVEILVLSALETAQALAEKALDVHGVTLLRRRQQNAAPAAAAAAAAQATIPPPNPQGQS